ncbi:MAG: hypothetical protein JW925_12795, partial [Syntrophaceae bacterium]|nr:hypothetical protein [Syntrophaceae bacterium]
MRKNTVFVAVVFSVFIIAHNPYGAFVHAQQPIAQEEDFVGLINRQGAVKATEYYQEFRKNNPNVVLFQRKTINNLGWQKAEQGDL